MLLSSGRSQWHNALEARSAAAALKQQPQKRPRLALTQPPTVVTVYEGELA